jgi:hypothetical protein
MERVIGIDHPGCWTRTGAQRAEERLRHRLAAQERCVRAGLLRRCTPVSPGAIRASCAT